MSRFTIISILSAVTALVLGVVGYLNFKPVDGNILSASIKEQLQFSPFVITGPDESPRYASVMNSNGVLMFVRSTNELSEAEWRWFFSHIVQQSTNNERAL